METYIEEKKEMKTNKLRTMWIPHGLWARMEAAAGQAGQLNVSAFFRSCVESVLLFQSQPSIKREKNMRRTVWMSDDLWERVEAAARLEERGKSDWFRSHMEAWLNGL